MSKIQRADSARLKNEYERKFLSQNIIADFISLFVFEKDKELQHVIHELKYSGKFSLGKYLGRLIAQELGERITEWKIDLIVPVPLHHLKRAERGYNQSDFIAKGIGAELKIPVQTNLLKRNRFTETQTTLSLDERKENVKDAFSLKRKKRIPNKNILLIDDVITTGATTAECGRILLQNGASKVYIASVAIAD
ncbi:MAG: ComF family protein [Bacteroidetes bacterium]|nr:ComF family protein [Bacteroidota bacterium]